MSDDEEREDFIADKTIAQRWGVSEKTARVAIRAFEADGRRGRPFPKRDPLFGGKRYWPAVQAYMRWRAGLTMTAPQAPDGQEHFNEPEDRRRPRPGISAAR